MAGGYRIALRGAAVAALLVASAGCASRCGPRGVQSLPAQCADDLVAERERAAARGLDWLQAYLDEDRHLAFLGADAVEIFLEAGMTARSAAVRQRCLAVASRYAEKLLPRYLQAGGLADRQNLTDAWTLVARADELSLRLDELVVRLRARMQSITTFAEEYGVKAVGVREVADDELVELLIDSYLIEKLRLAQPEIHSLPRWREVLDRLNDPASWRRAAADEAVREQLGYLASHVFYTLNDYGRLAVRPGDAPAAWTYMRSELGEALAQDELELAAEIVDIFHSAGLSESQDPALCDATRRLLAAQNPDGSWGTPEPDDDYYDEIHPTWTAVHGLRTRIFLSGTPFDRRRRVLSDEIDDLAKRRWPGASLMKAPERLRRPPRLPGWLLGPAARPGHVSFEP